MKKSYIYLLVFISSFFSTFGQNNALQISNNSYFSCNFRSSQYSYYLDNSTFTIEYDFYLNSLTDFNGRFSSSDINNVIAKPIHFYVNNSGASSLILGNGITEESIPAMPSFNAQQWYHIAFVVTNTATKNVKVYVNGIPTVDYNFTATLDGFSGLTPMTLGAAFTNSVTNVGNARFDNLRIWSTARTSTEIVDNYTSCLTGNETGLVSYFNFDGYNGRQIKNLANNAIINKLFFISADYSYTLGSGCTVTPLFAPITVTGSLPGIYYYAGQINGKPYYKTDNLDLMGCTIYSTQGQCATAPFYLEIIWLNDQWELRYEGCIWELGEECVLATTSNGSINPIAFNLDNTDFPTCTNWTFNGSFTGAFSSTDCDALSTISQELEKNITVFPNPANDILNIDSKENISIELVNILGESILTKSNISGLHKIQINNYAKGIYFLKVSNTAGNNKIFKIVKE